MATKKLTPAVAEFLMKMDSEGGLDEMAGYGMESYLKQMAKEDKKLVEALKAYGKARRKVNGLIDQYPEPSMYEEFNGN